MWLGVSSGTQGGSGHTPLPLELRSAVVGPTRTCRRVEIRKICVCRREENLRSHDLEGYRFCRLRWPTFVRLASMPPALHRRICPRQNTACIVPAGSVMPPGRSLCTSDRRFSSLRQTHIFRISTLRQVRVGPTTALRNSSGSGGGAPSPFLP